MTELGRGSESAIGAKEGDAPSAHPVVQTREGQRVSLPFLRLGICVMLPLRKPNLLSQFLPGRKATLNDATVDTVRCPEIAGGTKTSTGNQ